MKRIFFGLIGLTLILAGCSEDFMDVQPTDVISKITLDEYANSSPEAVISLTEPIVNGFYSRMITYQGNHDVFGQKSVDLAMDLQGMDMVQTIHHWFGWDYLMENRDYNYRRVNQAWAYYYQLIFSANEVLKLMPVVAVDPRLKSLKGQALAIRAYAYYYLVRIYQFTYDGHQQRLGVPLYRLTGAEWEDGRRATVQQVYDGIIEDFTMAYENLEGLTSASKNSIDAKTTALYLADAYLTMKNYEQAAFYANKARQGYSLMSATQYKEGFNDLSNPEVMWGADITAENTNYYATYNSHMSHWMSDGALADGYGGPYAPKAIYNVLYDAIPAGDVRKEVFEGSGPKMYYNRKFLQITGFLADLTYARVAEAYLIEAEALSYINEAQAKQVLYDLVNARYPAYTLSANTGDALKEEILLQKRIELWGEGRVQFDLKRLKRGVDRSDLTNNHRADARLVFPWNDKTFVFAMPSSEINANPNLELDENQ
jgi:starch-binding outer membrane protein, SusD/RagB family